MKQENYILQEEKQKRVFAYKRIFDFGLFVSNTFCLLILLCLPIVFESYLMALSRSFQGSFKVSQRYLIGISKVSDRFTKGSCDSSTLLVYSKYFAIRVRFVNVLRYTGLSPPIFLIPVRARCYRVFINLYKYSKCVIKLK